MSPALDEVRGRVSDMIQRLQSDVPGMATAVVAHGDFENARSTYVTKHVDFTHLLPQLVAFVNSVEETEGHVVAPFHRAAYDAVLRLVRTTLTWQPGSQRVLVVIGDACPHGPDSPLNTERIDWQEEVTLLAAMGVRIYAVQVGKDEQPTSFFRRLAEDTGGKHLCLSEFSTLCDILMAICYREKGAQFLENWEAEVRTRHTHKPLHRDLVGVFGTLRQAERDGAAVGASSGVSVDITPVKAAAAAKKAACAAKKMPPKAGSRISGAGRMKADVSKMPKAKSFLVDPTPDVATTPARRVGCAAKRGLNRGSSIQAVAGKTNAKATRQPRAKSFFRTSTSKSTFRKMVREKVPDTNFRFNNLKWSPWKLAVVPSGCEVTSGDWQTFLGGVAHVRTGPLVRGYRKRPGAVMVEVAVQTRPGGRRHVMWGRVLPCSSNRQVSVSRCLMGRALRLQLDKVVRSACRVWVRGALLTRQQPAADVRRQLVSVYDYAWGSQKDGCTREVWVPNGKPSHRIQIAGAAS